MLVGILVIIVNFHDYTGCIGTFKAEQDKLALVTMLYCPNGEKYDYLAGVPISSVKEYYDGSKVPRSQEVLQQEVP